MVHANRLPLNDRYYSTAPAAGVNASISDMSRFLLALLDEKNPLLKDEFSKPFFSPRWFLLLAADISDIGIKLAEKITVLDGGLWITKTGKLHTTVVMCMATKQKLPCAAGRILALFT
jgi:CubicO group peptidase (beta-lactamase class C family)